MSNYVDIERWRGRRDAVTLDPESMAYRDQPARKSCAGCCFQGQWSSVCKRATAVAIRAGLNDCDAGYVYVLVEKDPRQLEIVG